jgi:segregation and condensation protein B
MGKSASQLPRVRHPHAAWCAPMVKHAVDVEVDQNPSCENETPALVASVEGLLFVSDEPVPVGRLAQALDTTPRRVERALQDLDASYRGRGLRVQRRGSDVQLVSAPQAAPGIRKLLGLETRVRFSQAALETLAIVAYRQPITRPELESIRGVSADSVIRTLLSAGLVEEIGRAPTVGRPVLFGTTFEFLQHFGLRSLDELPPLDGVPGGEDE